MWTVLTCVVAAACVAVSQGVVVTSCIKPPANNVIKVKQLTLTPDPIQVPGVVSVSAVFNVIKSLGGNLQAELKIQKKLGPILVDIPCVNNVGSCTYRNVCRLLSNISCPQVFKQANLACSCPLAAGSYSIPNYSLDLQNGLMQFPLVAGEYLINARLTDVDSQTELACYDVKVEIKQSTGSNIFKQIGSFFTNLFG